LAEGRERLRELGGGRHLQGRQSPP
jgi:hypothetical protein